MKKGFTLIELIVSITIIALLTVVAVVSFSGTNAKARDSRRMSDLEKVRIALEMYKQANSKYPTVAQGLDALKPDYIQLVPADPKSTYAYYYNPVTNYTYDLCAYMENAADGNTTVVGAGTCASHCGGTSACNYRVTNP